MFYIRRQCPSCQCAPVAALLSRIVLAIFPTILMFLAAPPARAGWPLVWDFAGRSDVPVAALVGAGGDLWILSDSYPADLGLSRGVLLRVGPDAELRWATEAPALEFPKALALRPDGAALGIGRMAADLWVTAFHSDGTIAWSRSRGGLASDYPFNGPYSAPIWDPGATGGEGAWRIPAGLSGASGAMIVISFRANGDPLPDLLWSLPDGAGRATSLLPRSDGGLLVAGLVENVAVPGWWTVAFDASGAETWRRFESGAVIAGAFSGAFLLSADPVRLWATDENGCGIFSLELWALDAVSGTPLWNATWPTDGFPGCESFVPDAVTLAGGRLVASGVADTATPEASFQPVAVSFDAQTGALGWARVLTEGHAGVRTALSSVGGTALLASTLFPLPDPGPEPLWLAAWDRDGAACALPFEVLPMLVEASFVQPDGSWLLVGYFNSLGPTRDDVVVQHWVDPCPALFVDGFESGDPSAWTLATP